MFPDETLQEICRRITPKLILWGHVHPDSKSRDNHSQKRKLETNVTDEYKHKKP